MSEAKPNRLHDLMLVAALAFVLLELAVFFLLLIGGELDYFWSLGMHVALLIVSLILTGGVAVRGPPRHNLSPSAAPRHASGCRLCGDATAPTYSTEYGWYDTTTQRWSGGEQTHTHFEPWGTVDVSVCDACTIKVRSQREARPRALALRTFVIAAPLLLIALATRDGAWLEGVARRDYVTLAGIVSVLSAAALFYPFMFLIIALAQSLSEGTRKGRLSSVRASAQSLSWEIASAELEDRYETISTQTSTHDATVVRHASFGARSPEIDKWERSSRPPGFGPQLRAKPRPENGG